MTETGRHFKLSQPTVSAHVQMLARPGCWRRGRSVARAKLSATEQGIRQVFAEAEEQVAAQVRHQRAPR